MLKTYSVSLATGVLAGVVYALIDVSSPAPPVIALVGLLGMQLGEHLPPLGRQLLARQPVTLRWFRHEYHHRIGDNPPPPGDKTP